jgi:hypothetical protein
MSQSQNPQEHPQKNEIGEDKFRFQFVYLLPILASILFGLGYSLVFLPQSAPVLPMTPIPQETPGADWGTALYFVILLAGSATLFYFLLKHKRKRTITGLITLGLTAAAMLPSLVFFVALASYIPFLDNWIVVIFLSVMVTVLFVLSIFRLGNKARNTAVILIGGALGIFFGYNITIISLWSSVLILVFLSVYDVFAVYKGPVGKIAQSSGLEQLQGLSFSFKDIQMGLGDLVFYSMLTGTMIFGFPQSFLPVAASIVGIVVGSVITFYMLEKKNIFPGLPFPILLGLAFGLTVGFLM